jgi:transcriptional regulator GlxA family with amidase domain
MGGNRVRILNQPGSGTQTAPLRTHRLIAVPPARHNGTDPDPESMHTHVVAVLVAHGAPVVELAITSALFGTSHHDTQALPRSTGGWYEHEILVVDPGRRGQLSIAAVDTADGIGSLARADTIIVAAGPSIPPDPSDDVRQALSSARARGVRLVATGSGTFVLAAAGILSGLRATTHWSTVEELRRHHPDVLIDDGALFTEDSGVFTSAGAAATLDLCLELIRQDHGASVANSLARWMVAPPHRQGEHRQYLAAPLGEASEGLARVLDWASRHLAQPLTLEEMAQIAAVSSRTLNRRFHATLGTSPLQWLLTQRIRLAQELLESTHDSAEEIAKLTGFGTVGNLRHQFTKAIGMPPQHYRRMARDRADQRET